MNELQVPVTKHPRLPDEVPLVASFHDDRNRLSYYYPIVRSLDYVITPLTKFLPVRGNFQSYPDIEYRHATEFMQGLKLMTAFVRGDFSSGKYDGSTGTKIESQDPYEIETVVLEMLQQLARGKRHLGGRIAIREWIPHDIEVRYFIRGGEILYRDTLDESPDSWPDKTVQTVAQRFQTFAWSVDLIRYKTTGTWYLTDMGLDGLYHNGSEWIAISEHLQDEYSPEKYAEEMAQPERYMC